MTTPSADARGARKTMLRCGLLIDGSGNGAREDVGLLLEGGKVVSVEPWRESSGRVDGCAVAVEDFRGHTVVPGFIDGHAHLCLRSQGVLDPPGCIWPETNDPIDIVGWGLSSGLAALRTGITTVVDVGSYSGLALRIARLIDAGMVPGPKVLAAGMAITTTAGHGAEFGRLADDGQQLVRAVRAAVADGADLIKVMVTGGSIDPASNRRRAQYREPELRQAIADAHRLGKRVVGHANATEGITDAVRAGIDIVAHCNWLGRAPGTIELDLDTVEMMADRRVWVDLNIGGALRDLATDGAVVAWPGGLPQPRSRWELMSVMRDRGVPLYLTSDAFGPSIGGFTRSLRIARSQWSLNAEELIWLVSGAPATALGLDSERGRLESGRIADLVVLRGDLRTSPEALTRVVQVYRSGRPVVLDGWIRPPEVSLSAEADGRTPLLCDASLQGAV